MLQNERRFSSSPGGALRFRDSNPPCLPASFLERIVKRCQPGLVRYVGNVMVTTAPNAASGSPVEYHAPIFNAGLWLDKFDLRAGHLAALKATASASA
jgi:hypothetical protein